MFFPSSNTKPAEKNKKGGKDFTPCRPNRIRTSEQKNCPVLCGFHCTVPASVQVDLRFLDTTM